ncbi:MAG: hypothetical protein ACRBBS_06370 [Thalassovita sp.]
MNTPDHLVLLHRPWFSALGLLVFSLLFGAIALYLMQRDVAGGALFLLGPALGVLFMLVFVRQIRIVFSRIENTVQIDRRALLSRKTQELALAQIEKVGLQQTRSGAGLSFRIVLVGTKDSPHRKLPLTDHYSASRTPSNIAQTITEWLEPPAPQSQQNNGALDSTTLDV